MKPIPGTLQGGGASFRTTHWSAIADCALADDDKSDALAQLCRDYWPPLYSFVRRRGYSPSDAQDLVQGFFAAFLQNKAYARADRRKGKFRTFMLASFKHYLANAWNKEHALKRGGDREFVLLEEDKETAETLYASERAGSTLDEEHYYEQCWAAALVACALGRLGAEFWEGSNELPSREEIAQHLEMPIYQHFAKSLIAAAREFGALLREEVARPIGTADDLDEELRHFRKILIEF